MSLRFRKSVKIAPGVKVNVNKKSLGVTVGGKGVHVTKNTSGRTTTSVNLPVKGLSYTDIQTKGKAASATGAPSPTAANTGSTAPQAVAASRSTKQKVKVIAAAPPDTSTTVMGVVLIVAGFFLSGWFIPAGIIVAALGVYLIYAHISYRRHPDTDKYISADGLAKWRQLLGVDGGGVYELGKASLPVLVDLKKAAAGYADLLAEGPDQDAGRLLLDCQQKIVALSEFVILQGDNPQKDLEEYTALVNGSRA